mmetsp:Transcript_49385/g.86998  ORF Transcript_49385/g.86998 Transcript_49385/m.86998 type:complete len:335 (-) Transcript_49385:90-1094(-)
MAAETDDDRDVMDPCAPPVQPSSPKTPEESGPRDIAEASKKRANALYQNGLTYLQIGRVRDAFGEFKEATRLDPGNREIWQQYEETYREVEAELNAEQAVLASPHRSQAASSSQPLVSKPVVSGPLEKKPFEKAPSERFSKVMGVSSALPPTFTFNKPKDRGLKDLNLHHESLSEQDERSRQVADRMCRGHLTRDSPGMRNDDDLQFQDLVVQNHTPAKTLIHEVMKRKVFVTNLMIWLFIMSTVLYYYQVDRKIHYDQPLSPIGILFFGTLIVCFAVGCWKCVTAEQPIFVSLSDASKIVCGLIIVVCVIWHYSRRRPNELLHSNSAHGLQPS